MRFGTLIEFALLTRTRALDQRALKPLLAEALAYPDDCAPAYGQRIGYSVINLSFVGLNPNPPKSRGISAGAWVKDAARWRCGYDADAEAF